MAKRRRQFGPQLVGDPSPLGARCFGIVLGKRGGNEGGDDAPPALAGMRQRVAHEVHAAALPGGVEHLSDRGLDALMRVGDNQLDAKIAKLTKRTEGSLRQKARKLGISLGHRR